MIRTSLVFAVLSIAAAPCPAQTVVGISPDTTPAEAVTGAPKPATVQVTLQTSLGPIVLELEKERAPITTANFLRYVDQKRLDGTSFYRASKTAPGFGLVQGGVRFDPKKVLKPIAHEPTTKTGLHHGDGTISMARGAPGSATADFFIIVGDMPSLDAHPDQPGDNQGFAAFGHVVQGMDLIRQILDSPTSPTEGVGVMKGQMLAPPIKIVTARRVQ